MKLIIVIIFTILLSLEASAKEITNKDIVGGYKHILILPDNTFSILGLGTAIRGNWVLEKNQVTFRTRKEPLFILYGRKIETSPKLQQINFLYDFVGRDVKIGFHNKSQKEVQRLFKKDGCIGNGKYLYKQSKKFKNIYLAQKEDAFPLEPEYTVYEFSVPNEYNDFIAFMPKPENVNVQTFTAEFRDKQLFFKGMDGLERGGQTGRPLESFSDEELTWFTHFAKHYIYPAVLEYKPSPNDPLREMRPFVGSLDSKNPQSYVKIIPKITQEIVPESDKHLISVECGIND